VATFKHPYTSRAWSENCGAHGYADITSCALARVNQHGISTVITPFWALDCGFSGDYRKFMEELKSLTEPLRIIDLPPCSEELGGFSTADIKQLTSSDYRINWKHTRQLLLPFKATSNRRKQVARARREGISCELVRDWDMVAELHEESRNRKEIDHNGEQLRKLLGAISKEDFAFAVEARDSEGNCIASGGMVMVGPETCLYAFGGQIRGPHSAIASVAMLDFAMQEAHRRGARIFDFGGSSDPGVDRFYKEFGAKSVPKARLVYCAWWLKPVLRVLKPDLWA
jgi:hypothetical protein